VRRLIAAFVGVVTNKPRSPSQAALFPKKTPCLLVTTPTRARNDNLAIILIEHSPIFQHSHNLVLMRRLIAAFVGVVTNKPISLSQVALFPPPLLVTTPTRARTTPTKARKQSLLMIILIEQSPIFQQSHKPVLSKAICYYLSSCGEFHCFGP